MQKKLSLAIALTVYSTASFAQEAFVAQVGQVLVSTPAAPSIGPVTISQLTGSLPAVQVVTLPDLTSYLPLVPDGGPIADVNQTGTTHRGTIQQTGVHAAIIMQSGTNNVAAISQTNGSVNRASIIQTASNVSAGIVQRGSNNSAVIIQN